MKFTLLATLAFITAFVGAQTMIPNGEDCQSDGSMGICKSGYCEQRPKQKTGKCVELDD